MSPLWLADDAVLDVFEIVVLAVAAWEFRRVQQRPPLLLAAVLTATAATVIADAVSFTGVMPTDDVVGIRVAYSDLLRDGAGLAVLLALASAWLRHRPRRAPGIAKAVIRSRRSARNESRHVG
jgi:hypothetical protein